MGQTGGGGGKKEKGQPKEDGHAEDAVEEDGEGGAGLAVGKPAQEIENADGVTPGGADEEKVEEEADEGELQGAEEGQGDFLEAKKEPETDPAKQDGDQGEEERAGEPGGVGREEALAELAPVHLAGEEAEDAGGDGHPDPGGKAAQERGGWFFFHHARLARTSSADTSGDNSRETWASRGRRGRRREKGMEPRPRGRWSPCSGS